jgi:hypothetical protein
MDEMKFDKCGGCSVLAVIRLRRHCICLFNIVAILPSVKICHPVAPIDPEYNQDAMQKNRY